MTRIHQFRDDDPCALYWLHNANGELIYVGISFEPTTRVGTHRREQAWGSEISDEWTVIDWHPDRPSAEDAETDAIFVHQPPFNIKGAAKTGSERSGNVASRSTRTQEIVDAFHLIEQRRCEYEEVLRAGLQEGVPQVDISKALNRTREMLRRDAMPEEEREKLRQADAERKRRSKGSES